MLPFVITVASRLFSSPMRRICGLITSGCEWRWSRAGPRPMTFKTLQTANSTRSVTSEPPHAAADLEEGTGHGPTSRDGLPDLPLQVQHLPPLSVPLPQAQ